MRILSASEMQACDRATTELCGIPSIKLMRNAAASAAAFAREQFSNMRSVTVLCGRGNNGGDGMMAAQLLAEAGFAVTTVLLGSPDSLQGDAVEAWKELNSAHVRVVGAAEELVQHEDVLQADLLVDAILGTGFKPPLKGLALAAIEWAKNSSASVLAIDLPSGWEADATCAVHPEPVFSADAVLTFTAPKSAHIFGQLTRRWNQPVVVAPIGSPEKVIVSEQKLYWAGAATDLTRKQRSASVNKGNFGHVLVVGGTFGAAGGKAGAPAMAALAALRAGAGLVTAAVPLSAMKVVASFAPELMTWPLKENAFGQIAAVDVEMSVLMEGKTVLAVGPGLGQGADTAQFFSRLLLETNLPVVIDADGLNLLAKDTALMRDLCVQAQGGRTVVLTPHPGEMARLLNVTVTQVQADRLGMAREFAQRTGMITVLKGARTVIASADGEVAVNTTGNPGMAKGGSGDVLAGMVAGLMAQHPQQAKRAVAAAVFLHGFAADLAVDAGNEHTLLATDIFHKFTQAFSFDVCRENGYVWLQGLPMDVESHRGEAA